MLWSVFRCEEDLEESWCRDSMRTARGTRYGCVTEDVADADVLLGSESLDIDWIGRRRYDSRNRAG